MTTIAGNGTPRGLEVGSGAVRTILSIDPGTTRSAWVILRDGGVVSFAIWDNVDLLDSLRDQGPGDFGADVVVIEQIASYGMPVGAEIFDTVRWCGRFEEASRHVQVEHIKRLDVKLAICHDSRAKDGSIRAALIDRFGGAGAIKKGGTLHGVKSDIWAALAVAVTYADRQKVAA